jgi:hypothetical protein
MICLSCRKWRRNHFLAEGSRFAEEKQLSRHVTIKWRRTNSIEAWGRVLSSTSTLTRAMSGAKAGPYIRVIDLGENGRTTPHVHFLVGEQTAITAIRIARKKFSDRKAVNIRNDKVYELRGLLGYFFDKNAVPSFLDPNRVKGVRILSASRGMRCGFPKYRKEQSIYGGQPCTFEA